MTLRTLIFRSLRFHARSHLGVLLGAAVGSAVLIGALVVGDSVKESLRERAMSRLGWVDMAMSPSDRFFTQERRFSFGGGVEAIDANGQRVLQRTRPSTVLMLPGTVTREDGTARANRIQVMGVRFPRAGRMTGYTNYGFFGLAPKPSSIVIMPGQLYLNGALANQLRAQVGDELVLRVRKPSMLSLDAPLTPRSANATALRLRVMGILSPQQFGDFSLRASSEPPLNAFVSLPDLQDATGLTGRVNVLLVPRQFTSTQPFRNVLQHVLPRSYLNDVEMVTGNWKIWESDSKQVWMDDETAYELIKRDFVSWFQLADAELELGFSKSGDAVDLKSRRIFLDPPVVRAGLMADTNAQPILTYLVNQLRAGTNSTPYSMVTAAGPPWTPPDLRDDEIIVSQWLAKDLQVKAGDSLELTYFEPESGARLIEATNRFRVRSAAPMERPWADRTLMPDFPGIEKAESTHDWDAGFPLVHKIRPRDEDYWKQYRGTPKAFVTLAAGQKMWGNRFGNLTAIRFSVPTNATSALTLTLSPSDGERENRAQLQSETKTNASSTASRKSIDGQRLSPLPVGRGEGQGEGNSVEIFRTAIEKKILATLKPEELGLRFEPVRAQALKAAEQSQDFGQLFLGFSFFLIVAALLLMALLFSLALEQRAPEIGTLLALGFTPKQVRRLLLREGVALALLGGVLGACGGIVYSRAMLRGLTTIWRDAVGTSALSFHATPQTLLVGLLASVVVSTVTIWLAMRKFVRRPAIQLLSGANVEDAAVIRSTGRAIQPATFAWLALVAAVGLVGWTVAKGETANAGAFFGAGSLLLVAGIALTATLLSRLLRSQNTRRLTIGSLGLRGCARRRKRSLAIVAMVGCGAFMIAAIGVFRLDANLDATKRSSGTGGFALIGETTMPVVQDLNSKAGRDSFALNEGAIAGVSFVPFRVHEGDEASCLNLNRAQRPRLLGVKPEMLEGRFTFAKGTEWTLLKSEIRNPKSGIEIPALGDANSIQWAMGKSVGDTIDYVDERGQPFKVRIVGAVANSVLHGSLIIDEAEFVKRFPNESGYRTFLIDAPTNKVTEISATLSRALEDVGLELQPAAQKLAAFNAVQNTYLNTFQILGGLGLLLGSAGLGIVVLRNVLERRGELALLLAVGFRGRLLRWLVLSEHAALLWLGLGVGVVAAVVAVLPALLSPASGIPYLSLALTLAAVLVNGMIWTWLATRFALRGSLLDALRNE
ncbi:MAG: FtsX-like permease family protein [Verrucomicrobia bacterium]|nr:FtsX-like permease family protein [Verrucomicrobiota bacterium]